MTEAQKRDIVEAKIASFLASSFPGDLPYAEDIEEALETLYPGEGWTVAVESGVESLYPY